MLIHLCINSSCRLAFHLLRQSESHESIIEFLASFYTKKNHYPDSSSYPKELQNGSLQIYELGGSRFDLVIIGLVHNDEKPIPQDGRFQVVCHEIRPEEADINVGCCLHPVGVFR